MLERIQSIPRACWHSPLVWALVICATMMSPVIWQLPIASATVAHDLSVRYAVHPWVSGTIPTIGIPPIVDDTPIVPIVVKTIKYGKDKKQKRSAVDGSYQVASLGNVSVNSDEIEARPVMLRTPFGTDITTRVSLQGIPSELTGFLKRVQAQCGKVTVISGYRRTGVPGTCHAKHQALDYQIADPSCAMKVARSFRGGHSTDYYGVQAISRGMPAHFHVSNCGREMGARFVHRGSSDARVQVARRSRAKQTRVARARVKSTVRRTQVEKPYWTRES